MVELGIQIPVPWGHQPDAQPFDGSGGKAEEQYKRSRYNAGYIVGARTGADGGAEFQVDVPGAEVDPKGRLTTQVELPSGLKVQAAIGEVSAKIFPSWKDGKGRIWKDLVGHLALTPLPVVTNQKGFQDADAELATLQAAPDATETYLGRTSLLYELATGAAMPDDVKKKVEEKVIDKPADPPPPPPEKPAGAPAAEFARALQVLSKKGLHLPPGTTPENVWERICVIGHHDEEGGDDEDDDEGAGEGSASGGGGGAVEEAQRPIMMSTISDDDPLTKRMFQEKQEAHRALALKRIAKMARVEGGDVPFLQKATAERLTQAFGGYELSTTPDGDPIEQRADIELSAYWDAYQSSTQCKKAMARGGKEAKRPDAAPDRAKEQEEAGNELADRTMAGAK